jgi:hypothetical protein
LERTTVRPFEPLAWNWQLLQARAEQAAWHWLPVPAVFTECWPNQPCDGGSGCWRQETSMRKLILLIGVTFTLAAGTVMTIYYQPAVADCIGGGCSP